MGTQILHPPGVTHKHYDSGTVLPPRVVTHSTKDSCSGTRERRRRGVTGRWKEVPGTKKINQSSVRKDGEAGDKGRLVGDCYIGLTGLLPS